MLMQKTLKNNYFFYFLGIKYYGLYMSVQVAHKGSRQCHAEGQDLLISAALNVNKSTENVKVNRKEFDYSTFKRNFRFSDKFDSNNIFSRYENGILLIKTPVKNETKKESYKVDIF